MNKGLFFRPLQFKLPPAPSSERSRLYLGVGPSPAPPAAPGRKGESGREKGGNPRKGKEEGEKLHIMPHLLAQQGSFSRGQRNLDLRVPEPEGQVAICRESLLGPQPWEGPGDEWTGTDLSYLHGKASKPKG